MTTLPPLRRKVKRPKLEKPGQPLKSPTHRAWVRRHACSVAVCTSPTKIHAHHVKSRGAGGGDEWCVSLCALHHHEGDSVLGWQTFGKLYGLDLRELAKAFAEKSPDIAVREAAKRMVP